MSLYAQRAEARLQRHHRQAKTVTAWAMTSHFNAAGAHRPSVKVTLASATADPLTLTKTAKLLLPKLHEEVRYTRAGIVLTDLQNTGLEPTFDLFTDPHEERNIGPLIESIRKKLDQRLLAWEQRG